MTPIAERLQQVRARIDAACARASRRPNDVTLIAVSKRHPPQAIEAAWQAGERDFGENYAQELRDKANTLASLSPLRWHAIGPLQTNKAKYVAQHAHAFHALDRIEVASELAKRRVGSPLECFVEINLGAEDTKSGIAPEGLAALLEPLRALAQLRVVGLMGLPPLAEHAEASRVHFRKLRGLAREHGLAQLSMGTTHDFEVAIEEGATHVRVGTAIFGERTL